MNLFYSSIIISTVFSKLSNEEPLTKNQLRESLEQTNASLVVRGSLDANKFIANYLYVFQRIYADIDEINKRLNKIKKLRRATPARKIKPVKSLFNLRK